MKASKQLLKKLDISEDHVDFQSIKKMLQNNVGYMYLFTHLRFVEGVSVYHLNNLFNMLKDNKNILSDLPKPATEYRSYADLTSDIITAQRLSSVRKFIQVCPSNLKSVVRNAGKNGYSDRFVDACQIFSELDKAKQHLFTSVISRYKKYSAVNEALIRFSQYIQHEKDIFTVIEEINNTPYTFIRKVDFENNYVLVRVFKQNAMHQLGKGSAWCIADFNSTYWGNYVKDDITTVQYILYNFNVNPTNKQHRIGITVADKNITHAHQFNNDPIAPDKVKKMLDESLLKSDDDETFAEALVCNFVDGSHRTDNAKQRDMKRIFDTGYINKFIEAGLSSKFYAKELGSALSKYITSNAVLNMNESYNNFVVPLFNIIGSTKFFNFYIPTLHLLTVDTTKKLVKKGMLLKYGVHMDEIIQTYYKFNYDTETTEVVKIDGVLCKKVTRVTPVNSLSLDVLDVILSTNDKIVTNKALKFAAEVNNINLFKVLLKHFTGKIRGRSSYTQYSREFVDAIVEYENK